MYLSGSCKCQIVTTNGSEGTSKDTTSPWLVRGLLFSLDTCHPAGDLCMGEASETRQNSHHSEAQFLTSYLQKPYQQNAEHFLYGEKKSWGPEKEEVGMLTFKEGLSFPGKDVHKQSESENRRVHRESAHLVGVWSCSPSEEERWISPQRWGKVVANSRRVVVWKILNISSSSRKVAQIKKVLKNSLGNVKNQASF